MRVLVQPMETFFFRDAKPFDKGEGWASGIFPPLPSTLYGAFRSCAISQRSNLGDFYDEEKTITIRSEIGSPSSLGSFRIRSLFLEDSTCCLVPMPLDLLEHDQFQFLEPLTPNDVEVISDLDLTFRMAPSREHDIPSIPWLSGYDLRRYLLGETGLNAIPENEGPVLEEIKTGIQRDPKLGVAQEHMLYVQRMLRLKDGYRFSLEVENLTCLDDQGVLKVGHDGRLFSYEKEEGCSNLDCLGEAIVEEIKAFVEKDGNRFRILFTSPAVLAGGWLPGEVDQHYKWQIKGLEILIESAVVGRPMGIGGWDMKKRRPKPMSKAVPAGSVYYCKMIDGTIQELFDLLFNKNFCDGVPELEQQGFGHILIGAINS